MKSGYRQSAVDCEVAGARGAGSPRQRSGAPVLGIDELNAGQPSGWPARAFRTVGRGSHPKDCSAAEDPRSGLTAVGDRARGKRFRAQRWPFETLRHDPRERLGDRDGPQVLRRSRLGDAAAIADPAGVHAVRAVVMAALSDATGPFENSARRTRAPPSGAPGGRSPRRWPSGPERCGPTD